MASSTQCLNQAYVDQFYTRYLSSRFGVNSCVAARNLIIVDGEKILSDLGNYLDLSSPTISDRMLMLKCNRPTWADYLQSLPVNFTDASMNTSQSMSMNTIFTPVVTVPFAPIEVMVGSAAATALGIVAGSAIISNSFFVNQYIEIFRNNINLPSIDPGTGEVFFTKLPSSSVATLSTPLVTGEIIKIKIIT